MSVNDAVHNFEIASGRLIMPGQGLRLESLQLTFAYLNAAEEDA